MMGPRGDSPACLRTTALLQNPVEDQERGYTVVELLVSTLLSTLIMGGMYTALYQAQTSFEGQLDAMDLRQQARVTAEHVVPDVRMAGFRIGNLTEVIPDAGPDRITFVADIDNGSPELPCEAAIENAPNGGAERVTYAVNADYLVRIVECWNGERWSDGEKKIIARELVDTGPTFRYFNGAGDELPSGNSGLSAAERASVRSVTFSATFKEPDEQVSLLAVSDSVAADAGGTGESHGVYHVTFRANIRNVR